MDLTLRLAGESGDGVILAGEVLTYTISRVGLKVFTFRAYPSSIRGGQCMYQIRASDWYAYSQGDALDLLVAFDTEAVSSNVKDLKPEGRVVFDQDRTPRNSSSLLKRAFGAPFTSIARNQLAFPKARNLIIVGYVAGIIGISDVIMKEVVIAKLGSRGTAVLDKNILAIGLGFSLVPKEQIRVTPTGKANKVILSGNEAIAIGALVAGCRFYGRLPNYSS